MDIVPDDVVISGIGGYFPKAINVEEFKDRLFANESLLEQRFSETEVTNASGLLGCIESNYFDNSYFGIHRQQCFYMDPMHRLALERTFEALTDAGVNPAEIRGKRIGVFMGSTVGESDHLFMESVVSGFGVTGHSRAMLANRISYWLNLKGPSVAYDCNWVSGLEILRLAYCALKTGQCDGVIIGTTNLAQHAEFHFMYDDMGFLSSDGSTKAFDANAEGYARSEGAVVLFIQRSSEARRNYGTVVNVATRFDGTTADRFISVDEENMGQFLEEFYQKCKVKPQDVEYVETYGCGLKEIDKRELNALERVYCKERSKPLLIGSVKTVTGHAEASSALFSIVKTLIAMDADTIPATLQYTTPNPEIKGLTNGNLEVVTSNKKWNPTYAAVNGLGTSSYFGHVVFKANPKKKVEKKLDLPILLNASTRTEEGMNKIIETLKNKPHDPEFYSLVQQFFSKSIQGHLYRGYLLLGGEEPKHETINHMGNKRQIWFVYSGMGSQWNAMLGDLMQISIFAESINKSCAILDTKGVDLMRILSSDDKTIFDNILHCFVGIAAMQIALTDVLKALGIEPDGIIGHSVGELGCAYADGCMTHEQMILSSYSRGKASLEATLIPGMMAAIGLGYNQIKNKLPEPIEVACHNSSDSCTISGPEKDMEEFVATLSSGGTFAKLVNVANIAYHSRYIKPAAPLLRKYLQEVIPTPVPRSSKWISTSNLESNWDTDLAKHSSADYHTNNLLSSVLFEEGVKHIPKDSVLIEIAPHGLLQAILKRAAKDSTNVPLTRRGVKSGTEYLLQNLGKLHLAGVDMKLANIYPKIEYPVSRNTPTLADLVHWNHSDSWSRSEDTQKSKHGVRNVDVTMSSSEFSDCEGHKLNGQIVLPISAFLNMVLQISDNPQGAGLVFENLHFKKTVIVPPVGSVPLNAMIQQGSGEFEIFSDNDLILTGKMTVIDSEEDINLEKTEVELGPDSMKLSRDDVYSELDHRGYKYRGIFKTIKDLSLTPKGSISTTEWNNKWLLLLEAMIQQQLFNSGERNQDTHTPKHIQKITIVNHLLPKTESEVNVHFEYSSRLLYATGIEVSDMQTVPFESKSQNVRINKVDFVQLDNNVLNNMEAAIEQALQLCIANYNQQNVKKFYISEYVINNSLQDKIKKVVQEYAMYYINYTSVKEAKQITVTDSFPQLIILNEVVNNDVLKLVKNSDTAFLLAKVDRTQQLDAQITRVAYFRVGQDHYIVCRKATAAKPRLITIKEPTISLKDLQKKSLPWVAELSKTAEESSKQQLAPILLVASVVPAEGFNSFLDGIKSLPNMQYVRIFYNLDRTPDKVNEAIRRDTSLTILKNGQWLTYMPLSLKLQDDKLVERASTTPILENKLINYLGVNLKDETLSPNVRERNEIGNIDYCGVAKNGQRIMGLAYLDKENSKLVVDDKLTWEVPKDWTLESAVTVPNAYISAYYMLVIKARLKHGETVLIHSGCSAIGLAAISVAYSYGCEIYVTVTSERQRSYIRKQFRFLPARNVLSANTSQFESDLMFATGGKGAEVILNCVSGLLLKSSFQCVSCYGRFIQYGKYDLEEGNSIGMYCFLRNVSLYCVDLQNIFFQENEVKDELNKLIQEGINKCVVRSLRREVLTSKDIGNVMNILQNQETIGKVIIETGNTLNINKINFKDPNRFICNAKSSYLVLGGSATNWSYIAEWLVHRGARKIVIGSENKSKENHLNRRLQILQNYYGADLIMASSKIQTKAQATQLLSEVQNLGPLHAVFTLPQQLNNASNDNESVEILESVFKNVAPKALLVNFINSASGVCYKRAVADFETYNINLANQEDLKDATVCLDTILHSNLSNIILRRDNEDSSKQDSFKAVIKDVTKLIPTLDEIIRLQKNAPDEPELVQVLTEGPVEIRELSPLFIIPGLTGYKQLEEMLKHLLYPTFCAVLPATTWPLEKLAEVYAQRMCEVFPRGIYNIVSISSGGALAIEIAKILSKKNYSLHVYFVDSAPLRIQQGLQDLGDGVQFEVNLLRTIFEINDSQVVKNLKSGTNFESRIQLLLSQQSDISDKHKNLLERGLLTVKDYIEKIKAFKPDNELISGRIHILVPDDCSPYDSYGLSAYVKNFPLISQVGGDHLSIITNNDTSEYINKNHNQI